MNHFASASIMIVGDDSHFCHLLRSYIRRSAHQTMFAYPDDKVVKLAHHEKPALIVLDVDLPGSAGWNLLRELKAHTDTCKIPIMICSWLDEKERGTQAGANICLRMPILYGDFVDALNSVGVRAAAESE